MLSGRKMTQQNIFTIGYGNRSPDDFWGLLCRYEIKYLIDVRSKPYSKFNPGFSQRNLKTFIEKHKARYVFMGDLLGGQPPDPSCYTDGYADYTKMSAMPCFQKGIQRIMTANDKNIRVGIMCSELKPHECHRSKLIGEYLDKHGLEIWHISESGNLINQSEVIALVYGGQIALFEQGFRSRKPFIQIEPA